jgi:acyl carrier protein
VPEAIRAEIRRVARQKQEDTDDPSSNSSTPQLTVYSRGAPLDTAGESAPVDTSSDEWTIAGMRAPVAPDEFTIDDLMNLLTERCGLNATDQTRDPDARFADIGLDSLAFLSLQTSLQDRYDVEMPDDTSDRYTFGEIVEAVREQVRHRLGA